MKIEDFSYIKCTNCKNTIILPISYRSDYTLLSNMCYVYDEINECCDNIHNCFGSVERGIRFNEIKLSNLPFKLRKESSLEVTHEFDCGEHALIVTKYNGDKVLVYVDGERIIILDGMTENSIYIGEDKND